MQTTFAAIPSLRARRRGIALVLVLAVIGIATLMGAAILTSAALQSQSRGNTTAATQAHYLAESGVNLAIFYLQHPTRVRGALPNGFYPGQTDVLFSAEVPGTVDVAVTNVAGNIYEISATGWAGSDSLNRISRKLSARVEVNGEFKVTHASAFAGDVTIPASMTITGDVFSDGVVTKAEEAVINGLIYADGSNVSGWIVKPIFPTRAAPTLNQINLVQMLSAAMPYYDYIDSNGLTQRGYPDVLPSAVSGTLAPSPTNPKAVWYADSNVTLGSCVIDGTIVLLDSKKLNINGEAVVSARSGMPAVITSGVRFQSNMLPKSFTVNGLCWAGEITTTSGTPAENCTMVVNGALMMGGVAPVIDANVVGSINVNYVKNKVELPDFSDVNRTPQSVKVIRWGD